ncbi:MAG: xanthine dehydrogenase family protein molybdopterin-binding subunit [Alphaproteobacteria bacterium]|nr:xanthine dehydrogenase family protein molybdopterin-binding subunit [Alphaproteobacteria bacterium]
MTARLIGDPVRRKEDRRFLTGKGHYTDDINRAGQVYAVFVRSPHAHAEIKSINTKRAAGAPGIVAVYTGADLVKAGIGTLPCGWGVKNKDGSPMAEPPHPVLASGKVRHVGDPVAVVIAESKAAAEEAAERVDVTYKELPSVTAVDAAVKPGAPQLYDAVKGNLCYDWHIGDKAAADAAFAKAAHVTKLDIVNNRLVPNAMEPRAYIGDYDRATGEHTLFTTCQNPHAIRLLMGAFVLHVPEHKLRVVAPDVGGGFGSKIYHYAEEAAVTWAAAQLGRPVKWTAERSESFLSDAHGRDHVTHAELALDLSGKFLGLRVSTLANLGGYLSTFAAAVPTYLYATLLAGTYTTPAIYAEVKGVFTNTVPVDAYRGAGRPEASYLLERLVDKAANEIQIDPAELRRKNFIPKDAYPYQTPVALAYDSGDYFATLDMALKAADYAGFAKRRDDAKRHGKLRGIGLATYIEACGVAPSAVAGALGARAGLYEVAAVRVNPTGSVTVLTGTHSHGQGHETTFAQVVAERLGIPIDQVDVVHGDTAKTPFGMGTYGSRSLPVGGSALVKALDKVEAKGKKIAAHLLEAAEADIEFKDGKFTVAGTDKSKSFGEVALAAYIPHNYPLETLEPGLDETAYYDPKNFTFPSGAHVAEVEIDRDTGVVELLKFTAADDFGRIVNPMIVEGQVHGGLAQGIGQALFEECRYDPESGQLVTGSFMDYRMPRAGDLPSFAVATHATLCTHNPLGVKGCGEAGAIGAPGAVMNAVLNALSTVGVSDLQMPATPERVWRAINDSKAAA